jgi:competence protein CoiA
MQLFALDENGSPISALHALKQCDYFCMECRSIVRLRSGIHRRKHFFHINGTSSCRLNGKSLIHLQTQCYIQNCLPKEECLLEVPFPYIQRIADVVWEREKIIFEVQCSPITKEEVLQRNHDYKRAGYRVVWVLHDRQYNKIRVSSAELSLRDSSTFYYTNIDAEGNGLIYDQFDLIKRGMRCCVLEPLSIQVLKPFAVNPMLVKSDRKVPIAVKKRLENWKVAFEGDLIHITVCGDSLNGFLKRVLIEEQILTIRSKTLLDHVKSICRAIVINPYRLIFQYLLEKASR